MGDNDFPGVTQVDAILIRAYSCTSRFIHISQVHIFPWNQCVFINAVSSLVIGTASFITSLVLLFVLRITNALNSIKIILSIEGFLTMVAVLIIYVAISMIMPTFIISRRTPKEIITS